MKTNRVGEENLNNQGCLMRIVAFNHSHDIVVEFQEKYAYKVNTTYQNFKNGGIKNPFYPSVYGVGIIGNKYPRTINRKQTKEYSVWASMLQRCFDEKIKEKHPTYKDTTCCEEWLLYDNFYEWLHSQPNFDKWYNGKRWAVDKDILVKNNKIYSPDTCCLVPVNVNSLFTKGEAERGNYPIGVRYENEKFIAACRSPFLNRSEDLGFYSTPEKAFQAYKIYKENIIKQVAEIEYKAGNITEECYKAMMNYKVEIND